MEVCEKTIARLVPQAVSSGANVHERLPDEKNLLRLLDHSGNLRKNYAPASAVAETAEKQAARICQSTR